MSIFDKDGGGFRLPKDMNPDEQELLDGAEKVRTTLMFHAVWNALGKPHICLAVPEVFMVMIKRGNDGVMGVLYMVQGAIWSGPDAVSPEDKEAMLTGAAAVFTAMGGMVERIPNTDRMKVKFGDGDYIEVDADPFGSEVENFITEMDEALGPSTTPDPNDPWSRWM